MWFSKHSLITFFIEHTLLAVAVIALFIPFSFIFRQQKYKPLTMHCSGSVYLSWTCGGNVKIPTVNFAILKFLLGATPNSVEHSEAFYRWRRKRKRVRRSNSNRWVVLQSDEPDCGGLEVAAYETTWILFQPRKLGSRHLSNVANGLWPVRWHCYHRKLPASEETNQRLAPCYASTQRWELCLLWVGDLVAKLLT